MQILGLTAAEEELYRRLLRRPGLSVEEAVTAAGGPEGAAVRDVARLRALGAVVERDGALWPQDPELVVTRLSGRLLEELHTIVRGLGALRPVVESLQRETDRDPAPRQPPAAPDQGRRGRGRWGVRLTPGGARWRHAQPRPGSG